MEKNKSTYYKVAAGITTATFLISSCIPTIVETGERFKAREDITVDDDLNNPKNPECTIHKGEDITIGEFSLLPSGSNTKEPFIEFIGIDCRGWSIYSPTTTNKLETTN